MSDEAQGRASAVDHVAGDTGWWRTAAIYQVYPRSFADASGDGIGDLAGVRAKLPYLRSLGVDALWFSPWYVSPMADGGYDVADYRDIDPLFGTLADAEALITDAHAHQLKVIIDIVPNHCSDRHPWFAAALAAGPGAPERERFWFRAGRGEQGELPPNDWQSHFGGPAWTRITEPDGRPGEWYLHMFAAEQPDWNWNHPDVPADFHTTLRFWLDRGVDGFRIDVADHLVKDNELPDLASLPADRIRPYRDQDAVHDIYRGWRAIADEYPHKPIFVGELWDPDTVRFTRYLRPDELHTGFNFDYLSSPWNAGSLRHVIENTLASHSTVGAVPTWVISNHDVTRPVTRFGRAETSYSHGRPIGVAVDLAIGARRARAAALLGLSLPGCYYLYQGEELGLWEVEDLPLELREDPTLHRSNGADLGRDGCRVPLPWSGDAAPFGFGPDGSTPWLPQPAAWAAYTAQAQSGDRDSMLELYRRALRIRRTEPSLATGELRWLPSDDGVLSFRRGDGFACLVNLSPQPVALPRHECLLLASEPLVDLRLPVDTAVWLRTG
jgi:alpha-glucosidase